MSPKVTDLDFLLARASDPASFERWLDVARSTGWCQRPVRLAGTTQQIDPGTGEIFSSYTTAGEPDGHLLKACGTRKATVCEPCSAMYRADAWHLIAAGLRGGKGIPEDAATHLTLFVTLTAPCFGPVTRGEIGTAPPECATSEESRGASTAATRIAGRLINQTTNASANRSAPTVSTTPVPSCGMPTPPNCGVAPPSGSDASWRK